MHASLAWVAGRRRVFRTSAWAAIALCLMRVQASELADLPPPPELFWRPARLHAATLSPSGEKLAVVSSQPGTRRALVVLNLRERGRAAAVLRLADADIVNPYWVNDDRLLFRSGLVDKVKVGERMPPGLYAVNADGSDLLQLTHNHYELANEELMREKAGFPLAPAAALLAVPSPSVGHFNENVLVTRWTEDGNLAPFWLNVRTREQRPDDFGLKGSIRRLYISPDGEPRAAVIADNDILKLVRRLPSTNAWMQMPDVPMRDAIPGIHVRHSIPVIADVDNQGTIYALGYAATDDHAILLKLDSTEASFTSTPVAAVSGFDFDGRLVFDSSGGETVGLRVKHARETTYWRSPAMREFQISVDRLFPDTVNEITCARCGGPEMVALIDSFSDRDPGRVRVYRAGAENPNEQWLDLGPIRPEFEREKMALVDHKRIVARDGRELPLWITRPARAEKPAHTIVLVHGGPWIRGGYWGWHPLQQFLASRGYLVIEPEMRGSKGYGLGHLQAGFRQFGQTMQDDVADALLWAQSQGLASTKSCIMGASYGGYSALMGLIKHPELYRCAIAQVATADLSLYLEGSFWVNDDIPSRSRKHVLPLTVGDSKKDAAMIAENSPVLNAAKIKSPVLLAYAEEDRRIPLAHGKRLRKAMTDAGNPPEWVTYPGEGHSGWTITNEVDFARRVEAFLAKHLANQ